MSEETTLAVINTLCPLCWREEKIKVEGDLPCVECQEAQKKGFLCIGVDFSKSDSVDKAIRTGHRWIISVEAARNLYGDHTIERGAGLLDIEEAKQLGLPVQTSGYTKAKEAETKTIITGKNKCVICNEEILTGDDLTIDKEKGFMHIKCAPLKLI
jgi:hypothetical protein